MPIDADNPPPSKHSSTGLLLVVIVLLGAFGVGYALTGSSVGYRLLGGGLAVAGVAALGASVLAVMYAWMRVRDARSEAAVRPHLERLDAMSDDDLRQSVLAAISGSGCFATVPASGQVNPSWPRDVREVFERFDRVAFTPPGEREAAFVLERSAVALAPEYSGALTVGRALMAGMPVVIHLPTGRVVVGFGSLTRDSVERAAASPSDSHRSLWHFMAAQALGHRPGSEAMAAASVQPASR